MKNTAFTVNLEYYKSFYYVAQCGTVTEAAEHLCLTQPTVTSAIQKLETQLGCSLFVRTKRGVTLTAEGKVLWERVRPACRLLLAAEQDLEALRHLNGGSLSIASTEMSFRTYVLPALEQFTQDYPNVKIQFQNAPLNDTILDLLRSGEIDLAILHAPFQVGAHLQTRQIGKIEECFAAGPKYAFLAECTQTMAELLQYPFVSVPKGASTEQYVSELFRQQGLSYEPDMEMSTIELVIQAVKHNLGIAMLPLQRIHQEVQRNELFRIPVKGPAMERKAYVITHSSIPLRPAAQVFLDQYLPGTEPKK